MKLFSKKKRDFYVVKKRTPDITPFKIARPTSGQNAHDEKTIFTSPIGIQNDNPTYIPNERNDSIDRYGAFMDPNKKYVDQTYSEFPQIRYTSDGQIKEAPKPVTEPKETVKVTVTETPVTQTVIEGTTYEEPTGFDYDDTQEYNNGNEQIDSSLLGNLFGSEPTIKEPKEKVEKKVEDTRVEPSYTLNDSVQQEMVEEIVEETYSEPVQKEVEKEKPVVNRYKNYKLPPIDLLDRPEQKGGNDNSWIERNVEIINETLTAYKIRGSVVEYSKGPTFTRYAIKMEPGESGSKIQSNATDFQRALSAVSIRIENPILGKPYVGIEVPNAVRDTVTLRELVENDKFMGSKDPLCIPVGKDVEGKNEYVSIGSLPHGLVAGTSGSGKSVFITCTLTALLMKNKPDDLKIILVDPKQVDLSIFADIPHLLCPIISEVKEAVNVLKWLYDEGERRFSVMRGAGVQKLADYNEICEENKNLQKMPYIVVVIEEAGDFMLNGGKEAQEIVTKLVQKVRAAGIHIFLSMQKPVKDVLSTTIKSNAAGRFALKVTDSSDSMLIIGQGGADKLLGYGDMLFYNNGLIKRYQSGFCKTKEIFRVKQYICEQAEPDYAFNPADLGKNSNDKDGMEMDEMFEDVAIYVVNAGRCSNNAISQDFHFGFNRTSEIVRQLEFYGIVSENKGTTARKVLVSVDEIQDKLDRIMGRK